MAEHPRTIPDVKIERFRKAALYMGSAFFALLTLLLLYKVPYNGDDMINCLTDGGLAFSNRSLYDHTLSLLKSWMDSGRFYPLAFYSYAMFSVFPTLFAYRTVQIILNMAVILSFSALIKKLTANDLFAVAGILLAPVFFQYRYYQDPITAYHGMLQLVALYVIWAMYFQIEGLQSNKFRYQIIGMIFFSAALLTYEISFAFIVLFLLIPFIYEKGRRVVLPMLPYLFVTGVILSFTLYLRAIAPNPTYAGISFSWDAYGIVKAFLSQLSAAIPLSYWLLATPDFMIYSIGILIKSITVFDVILTLILGVMLALSLTYLPSGKAGKRMLLLGLLLWVLPATILSLSARYQTELSPGVGYLPVYIQYFGGIVIALYLCAFLLSRFKKERKRKIVSIVLIFCFSIGFLLNNVNNRTIQQVYSNNNRQDVSTYALEQGIMEFVDDNASLLTVEGGYGMNFEPTSFAYKYGESLRIIPKSLQALHDEVVVSGQPVTGKLEPESLYVYVASGDLTNGIAQIARITSLEYDPDTMTIVKMYASEIQMVVIGYNDAWFQIQSRSQGSNVTYSFSIEEVSDTSSGSLTDSMESMSLQGTPDLMMEISHLDRQDDIADMIFSLNRNRAERFAFSAANGEEFLFPVQTA